MLNVVPRFFSSINFCVQQAFRHFNISSEAPPSNVENSKSEMRPPSVEYLTSEARSSGHPVGKKSKDVLRMSI